jgi:hypothetical protein
MMRRAKTKLQLLLIVVSCYSVTNLFAQTFTFGNYNTSPGAGITSNYTETSAGVTMTVATSVSGVAGWTALCSVNSPGYVSGCNSAAGLSRNVNWADRTSTVTTTITFSSPISCASFNIFNINRNSYNGGCSNLFTDVVDISGDNSGTSVAPSITQSASADQTITGTTTKTITGTEGSLGGAVTVSFTANINRIVVVYKSAASITSSLGCAGGSTNPRDQFIILGAISGSSANYGTLNGGNITSCLSIDPSPILFSSPPSGAPTYQWYSKPGINACPTGTSTAGWTLISGATSSSYDPPAVTSSTTYACLVSVSGCGSSTWASGCKSITVDNTNATASPTMSNGDYLWQGAPSSAVSDVIVDDINAVFYGTGWTASANPGFYGSGSKNSLYIGVSGAPTRWVYFYPTIVTPGRYEVFEKHVGSSNRSAAAPVKVSHANGITSTTLNQESNTNSAADITTWTSLGTYYFNAGNDGYVYYENVGEVNTEYLNVDAVAFVFKGSNIYETATNWLKYNGTNYTVATVAPTTADHVFIKQTGACVNGYPLVTTTGAQSNNLTIGTSAQLTSNNATNLTVAGNWSNSGSYIENQGKITFTGNAKTLTCSGGETFYDLSSSNTSVLTLNNDAVVTNGLWLNGIISTGSNRVNLNTSATDGVSSGIIDGNYSGHINGNFRRTVSTNTATYRFPMGVGTTLTTNRRLMEWVNNNLTGISYLDCSVSNSFKGSGQNTDANISSSLAVQNGKVVYLIHPEAQWRLGPNTNPTGGSYGMRLYVQNFSSLSASSDNKFIVLKRPDNSTTFADYNTFESTTTIPPQNVAGRVFNSGNGYAQRLGFTSFSEFVIGSVPTPLGVELGTFDLKCDRDGYMLNYSTVSEINSSHFQISTSNNGYDFTVNSEVDAQGYSSSLMEYQIFIAKGSYNYVQLEQFDFDGQSEELFTLHVPSCIEGSKPFIRQDLNEDVLVILPYSSPSDIFLYSTDGKLLFEGNSIGVENEVLKLPRELFTVGSYFLRVDNKMVDSEVFKFIKF